MRVSHKFKYIFVSIPKTASTAIRESLNDYCDVSSDSYPTHPGAVNAKYNKNFDKNFLPHLKLFEIQEKFEERNWNYNDYTKFTVIRNPWDREVSHYTYKKRIVEKFNKYKSGAWKPKHKFNVDYAKDCERIIELYPNFNDFVKSEKWQTMSPCYNWMTNKSNTYDIQYALRKENLQRDFNMVCGIIGLPPIRLEHRGFSGRISTLEDREKKEFKHYSEYYDQESIDIINFRYKLDIEKFNYTFESV